MRVVVAALGRPQAFGERERIRTWQLVLAAAGHEVLVVHLLDGRGPRPPALRQLAWAVTGEVVPETLRWSPRTAMATIEPFSPDAVIAVTARAHHPALAAASPRYVLDLVDLLSTSYRDRARALHALHSAGYLALSGAHRRFERNLRRSRTVLAGHAEAAKLGAVWLPLVRMPPEPTDAGRPSVDVVFFGNLAYPPNVEAVIELGRLWPGVLARRPNTTTRIAGFRPSRVVREVVDRHRWELVADFDHLGDVLGGAQVAVAPLRHASGIQTKVLDAADHSVCQLISPAAARGLHPSAPFPVAALGSPFVERLVSLLGDPAARRLAASSGRAEIERWHRPERWTSVANALISE